jgi:uncharacterized protein YecE (DUF72 family)
VQSELFPGRPQVLPAPPGDGLRATASAMPPGVRLGTSSWTFPGWVGLLWERPTSDELLAHHGLPAYAAHPLMRTVGVDRSYWAPVPAETLQQWARAVPADFRFLCKAHEHLTVARFPDLPRYGARKGTNNPLFLDPAYAADAVVGPLVENLGDRLGPIVFQLPPQPGLDPERFVASLSRFLAALPRGPTYAVEIRNADLLVPAYADALLAAGAVHCLTVHPGLPDLRTQWRVARVSEGRALVIRWNLAPGWKYEAAKATWAPFDRVVEPDPERREQIARSLLWADGRGLPAYVIANNKAEGSAPETLRLLAERTVALRTDG